MDITPEPSLSGPLEAQTVCVKRPPEFSLQSNADASSTSRRVCSVCADVPHHERLHAQPPAAVERPVSKCLITSFSSSAGEPAPRKQM